MSGMGSTAFTVWTKDVYQEKALMAQMVNNWGSFFMTCELDVLFSLEINDVFVFLYLYFVLK